MPTAGTLWGLPNYYGELYTADALNTPLLTMAGGLTGGKVVDNFEFPTSSNYSLPSAAQPVITETDSLTAPTADHVARTQVKNVCQIHHEAIDLSYVKQANSGRISGISTFGTENNAPSELDFQKARKLEKIARDVEYSFINGAYQISTAANVANKTRGMVEVTALAGGTAVNAAGAALDLAVMQSLFLTMHTNGAVFSNVVLYVPGSVKQKLSKIYGYAPADRVVGGVNIQQLETDFGNVGIVVSRFAPANTVLAIEMSAIDVVFQESPGKGLLYYEDLAKTGASDKGQMFSMIGLDHGPAFVHGRLHNFI